MEPIIESGMTFGPYSDGCCFRIEGSELCESLGEGIKIVEFLKLGSHKGQPQVWLVEAKSSAPRAIRHEYDDFIHRLQTEGYARMPEAGVELKAFVDFIRDEGLRSFPSLPNALADYIDDIRQKMENALALFFASRLNRHPKHTSAWPQKFREIDMQVVGFRFVLVIKTARNDALAPLNDALRRSLRPISKTWALDSNPVVVLNEEGAKRHGLISKSQP